MREKESQKQNVLKCPEHLEHVIFSGRRTLSGIYEGSQELIRGGGAICEKAHLFGFLVLLNSFDAESVIRCLQIIFKVTRAF